MTNGQAVEALTLTALRDRLSEIIQENDRRGWSERNQTPVVVQCNQGKTAKGRTKHPHYYPIMFVRSSLNGLIGQPGKPFLGFAVLESGWDGTVITSASRIKTRKVVGS